MPLAISTLYTILVGNPLLRNDREVANISSCTQLYHVLASWESLDKPRGPVLSAPKALWYCLLVKQCAQTPAEPYSWKTEITSKTRSLTNYIRPSRCLAVTLLLTCKRLRFLFCCGQLLIPSWIVDHTVLNTVVNSATISRYLETRCCQWGLTCMIVVYRWHCIWNWSVPISVRSATLTTFLATESYFLLLQYRALCEYFRYHTTIKCCCELTVCWLSWVPSSGYCLSTVNKHYTKERKTTLMNNLKCLMYSI